MCDGHKNVHLQHLDLFNLKEYCYKNNKNRTVISVSYPFRLLNAGSNSKKLIKPLHLIISQHVTQVIKKPNAFSLFSSNVFTYGVFNNGVPKC